MGKKRNIWHIFSYLQPFVRYSKISAHASRAENRGTYMSNGSQRVIQRCEKFQISPKSVFLPVFGSKMKYLAKFGHFSKKFFKIWAMLTL